MAKCFPKCDWGPWEQKTLNTGVPTHRAPGTGNQKSASTVLVRVCKRCRQKEMKNG